MTDFEREWQKVLEASVRHLLHAHWDGKRWVLVLMPEEWPFPSICDTAKCRGVIQVREAR